MSDLVDPGTAAGVTMVVRLQSSPDAQSPARGAKL
ncbi:hypothetical protein SPHINGOAX6_40356 [Sphingomonas sp. AX6]|nr:hypothetical protein SPHINGOAX6_40356 [Sphingomonas sp. AX6]